MIFKKSTKKKKKHESLQKVKDQLKAALAEKQHLSHQVMQKSLELSKKSEFISIASHQLRTPLSAVKWTLKMMLSGDMGKLSQEQRIFLEKTFDSNERMIGLVNDLLDVSRIEQGRLTDKKSQFNIIKLVNDILNQYKVLIAQKKLKFETDFNKKKEIIVLGDPERLSLVFNNLIDNAIKFSPDRKRITLTVRQKPGWIIFIIKDQGIGVSEKDQSKLFAKFFRSESATKMRTHGTGLGLFIAKNIIDKHQGDIKFESVLGKGSKVTCRLPQ